MKYKIYLLSYNNYNNRQVKKLNSISDYVNAGYVLSSFETANFEYKDGISSGLIVNKKFVNQEPDYILVEDIETRVVDNSTDPATVSEGQFSRWFIIDSDLIRGNQYQFTIRRDIWVDHFDLCMNSTYFIERGYVSDSNDLIFNDEQQRFSQIKKGQTPLYDETGVSWIVGYMPKTLNKTSDTTIKATYQADEADIVVSDITQWDYWQYVASNPSHTSIYSDDVSDAYRFVVKLPVKNTTSQGSSYQLLYMGVSASSKSIYGADVHTYKTLYPSAFTEVESGLGYFTRTQSGYEDDVTNYNWYNETQCSLNSYIDIINRGLLYQQIPPLQNNALAYSQLMTAYKGIYNPNNSLVNYLENSINGRTIKDTNTGKVYTISLNDRVVDNLTGAGYDLSDVRAKIRFLLNLDIDNNYGTSEHSSVASDNDQIQPIFRVKSVQIQLTEVAVARTTIPKDDVTNGDTITIYRNHTVDQVYDMFAIPYKGYHTVIEDGVPVEKLRKLTVKSGTDYYECNPDIALNIAQSFVTQLGDGLVYDLQILPYCPCREYIKSDYTFDITGVSDIKVRPILSGNNLIPVGYVFYCSSSKVNDIILLNKDNYYNPYSIEITDTKLQYNTEMYRLSGPNFASSFEFNAAQNNGVDKFLMSFTYKPYNPYIRIRPEFKRMFGENFKDGRGLILQGDFSVATMSNAWSNYELQNKNYLNAFNREISSMYLQNKISEENDMWNAFAGSIQGIGSGAVAGGLTAGPYGAIAGAVIGGAASIAGGVKDVQNNRKLRNDAIGKAKALFNYQLDNIKALPNTIRNIGCLTVDNVLVPVLEFYQASDDEIDTFIKKMKYYGMSVMKVGQITNYIDSAEETFIQGYLLRLLPPDGVDTEADNHLAEEISDELQKGLYIGG